MTGKVTPIAWSPGGLCRVACRLKKRERKGEKENEIKENTKRSITKLS